MFTELNSIESSVCLSRIGCIDSIEGVAFVEASDSHCIERHGNNEFVHVCFI